MKPSKRLWRTLLRVSKVYKNSVNLVIPGWGIHTYVKVPIEIIPENKRHLLKKDYRFHARVNIGVDNKKGLTFKKPFEMEEDK